MYNNKFILLLQKDVYPYEYKDNWKKLNETSLPVKVSFYSHLYVEDITDADYAQKKVLENIYIYIYIYIYI